MLAGGMFVNEFKDLLSFIDTLEVKEIGVDLGDPKGDVEVKTAWTDLEEAAIKYGNCFEKHSDLASMAFIKGAKWQEKHLMDKACSFLHHYQEYPNHDIATGSLIEAFKMFIEL